MQSGTAGITWRAFAQPWGDDPCVCAVAFRELMPVSVEKSAYHHQSQAEIASDNPCYRHLSGVSDFLISPALAKLDTSNLASLT